MIARPTLQRPSLTALTEDAILDLIQERRLREGDPIPVESELAQTLGVSRTVVREAIAQLSGQGLLKRQQGSPTIITLPGSTQLRRLVRLRFALQGSSAEQALEMRESVEVAAARLAAQRATPTHLMQLRERLADLRKAQGVEELHQADLAFHRAVTAASQNDLMAITLEAMTPILDELLVRVWEGWVHSKHATSDLVEAHALILERIEAGDPTGAGMAMRANLKQGRVGLEAHG